MCAQEGPKAHKWAECKIGFKKLPQTAGWYCAIWIPCGKATFKRYTTTILTCLYPQCSLGPIFKSPFLHSSQLWAVYSFKGAHSGHYGNEGSHRASNFDAGEPTTYYRSMHQLHHVHTAHHAFIDQQDHPDTHNQRHTSKLYSTSLKTKYGGLFNFFVLPLTNFSKIIVTNPEICEAFGKIEYVCITVKGSLVFQLFQFSFLYFPLKR